MITARGYAIHEPGAPLAPWIFQRREPGPDDVQIEILYTGICHTDLHQATDHWSGGGIFGWGVRVACADRSVPRGGAGSENRPRQGYSACDAGGYREIHHRPSNARTALTTAQLMLTASL
jgi:hypothetical protein